MPTATRVRNKKRSGAGTVLAVLVVLAVVGAMLGGYFLLASLVGTPQQAPVLPTGPLRAIVLDTATALWHHEAATEEELTAYIHKVTDFAAEYGFNAVVVPVQTADGIFYRDKEYPSLPALAAQDSFFHHYDALSVLCAAAGQKNIAVYAQMDAAAAAVADTATLQKTVEKLQKDYPLAGLLTQEARNAQTNVLTLENGAAVQTPTYQKVYVADSAAVQTLLLTANSYSGVVLGTYEEISADIQSYSVLVSALDTSVAAPAPLGYIPAQALQVTYPAEGAALQTATTYLMGTSNAAESLTMNGEPVAVRGENGVWGAHISLQAGQNTIEFANGSETVTLTVNYTAPTGTGEQNKWTTQELDGGTVQVTQWISSVLSEATSDDSITGTARQGAVASVVKRLDKNGTPYAYQLANGDWLRAANISWLDTVPEMNFTGAAAMQDGRMETITFAGSGTPLAYTDFSYDALTLTFANTTLAESFAVEKSTLVTASTVSSTEKGATLTLQFNEKLWGFSVEYVNGTVQLLLKKAPQQSTVFGKPLTGVTVLLDAGHGGTDGGAMGAAGTAAPVEKDVNLAVAKAAQYRLEQMGATVVMTRTGDEFPSLEDRLRKISEVQPDYFIAVHHNSTALVDDTSTTAGVECYYFYHNYSGNLAEALVKNLTTQLHRTDRGVFGGYYYYVTRASICPAVLLECGFMPCPTEYEDIIKDTQVLSAGNAVAQSILDVTPQPDAAQAVPDTTQPPAQSTAQPSGSVPVDSAAVETDAPAQSGAITHPLA